MIQTRRSFINSILAYLLTGLPRFGVAKTVDEKLARYAKLANAIAKETDGREVTASERVQMETPEIAEDGSIVPISIESDIPNVQTLWVFVAKNPTPLAARFDLEENLEPFVSLRIKMNESSEVMALVKSPDGYFSAKKNVRVIVGGCG